jgi:chromosomal replication initiation ATPase DnaA
MATVDDLIERGLAEVAHTIALRHHVTVRDILGRARLKPICAARTEFWHELAIARDWGFSATAKFVGRDHQTVMVAIAKKQSPAGASDGASVGAAATGATTVNVTTPGARCNGDHHA